MDFPFGDELDSDMSVSFRGEAPPSNGGENVMKKKESHPYSQPFLKDITWTELCFMGIVLLLIGISSYANFQMSFVRSRDVQRKNDLKHIAAALNSYLYDFGHYPPSSEGNIIACGDAEHPRACVWGEDGIRDLTDPTYPPYVDPLPRDPQKGKGRSYVYISNSSNFQLFASLENEKDDEYNEKVAQRHLVCEIGICNFGIASSGKPEEEMSMATPSAQPANEEK